MRLLTILLAGTTLCGCVFDDDLRFVPQTHTGFILSQQTDQKSLIRIIADQVERDWKVYPGVGEISDFSGTEKTIWFAEGDKRQIFEYDPENQQVLQTFSTGELTPDYICVGESVILICDSVEEKIGFFRLKNEKLTLTTPGYKPGKAVYRSGKFYVKADDRIVDIYDEQAFASIGKAIFEYKIVEIEADARSRIFIHTREGNTSRQAFIDYNSNNIAEPEKVVAYEKIRYTPYVENPLGKEYMRDLQQVNGKLNIAGSPVCSDFEIDFFESVVYFIRQDSLYSLHIIDNAEAARIPLTGKFQKAWYFIKQIP
ncbi:MAG: hypothetical protein SF052_20140 [Bacteroidia bacterium]|nr:hypothetical protein [Bacteroidia bacterium]